MNLVQSLRELDDVMDRCKRSIGHSWNETAVVAQLYSAYAQLQQVRNDTQRLITQIQEKAEPKVPTWGTYVPGVTDVVMTNSSYTADGNT